MWNLMAAKHRWRHAPGGSMASERDEDDVTKTDDKQKSHDFADGPIKDRKLKFKDETGQIEDDVIVATEADDVEIAMDSGIRDITLDSDGDGGKHCNGKDKFKNGEATSSDDLTHHDDEDGNPKKKKKKCSTPHALLKDLSWHLGPLVLLIAYCALGALVMEFLESGHELDVRAKSQEYRNEVVEELVNVTSSGDNANLSASILEVIKGYEEKMLKTYSQGVTNPNNTKWSFKAALFFTATVVSTVGYGHITPVTKSGRIFCMFFAFFGIPIMLLSVTRCGQGLAKLVQLAITACRNKSGMACSCLISKDNKQFTIPVYFAIIFLIFYMFFGSLLFRLWEDWTILEAFYFCFITMTTIGFGDIIPEHPNFMLLCTLYLILGLAIMSMCFELAETEYVKRMNTVRRGFKEVKKFTKSVKIKSTSRSSLSSGKMKSSNSYEVTGQDSREISRDDHESRVGDEKKKESISSSLEKVSAL
ncbi:potassium channel subfamily K member 18-like isoform X2 [Lineus longissimus]|uniref:potassium channel subfamily K member 18-like isoform X2 n=1 Tax=Lineus longissimus TaxID=88925 RepID=UPI002B4CC27D